LRGDLTESERILFEQNYINVFKAVYIYCRDYNLAEDTTQDAFYKAFKNLHQLKKRESFALWVYTIAVNLLKTEYRKNNKVFQVDLEKLENKLSSPDSYEKVEIKADIKGFLDKLDYHNRHLIILHYFYELSLEEVSDLINENKNAVKTRLYRTRQKMKALMLKENYILKKEGKNKNI